MEHIKVLYYLTTHDSTIFIELKNIQNKTSKDKSKYVSWFMIKKNIPTKLKFISIDDGIRKLNIGSFILNKKIKVFIDEKQQIFILKNDYIHIDNIKACVDIW